MKAQSAKNIALFVWKAGLILGALVFGYLAKYFPGIEIAHLGFKYTGALIILSISLYVVAKLEDRKAK